MNPPDRESFPSPRIGTAQTLNRMAEKRADEDWVKSRLDDSKTRFLLLADLSVAVDSAPDKTETKLRWYTAEQIEALGVDLHDTLLLGCNEDDVTIFAVSLSSAQVANVPGGAETLKPLVDLRSLAMQGDLSRTISRSPASPAPLPPGTRSQNAAVGAAGRRAARTPAGGGGAGPAARNSIPGRTRR